MCKKALLNIHIISSERETTWQVIKPEKLPQDQWEKSIPGNTKTGDISNTIVDHITSFNHAHYVTSKYKYVKILYKHEMPIYCKIFLQQVSFSTSMSYVKSWKWFKK